MIEEPGELPPAVVVRAEAAEKVEATKPSPGAIDIVTSPPNRLPAPTPVIASSLAAPVFEVLQPAPLVPAFDAPTPAPI
jgi:hypothetical protein